MGLGEHDVGIAPGIEPLFQAWFGWRHKHYEDGVYSELLLPLSGHEATDQNPLAVQWWNDYVADVPEGTPGSIHIASGVWDAIWDCACNIQMRRITAEKAPDAIGPYTQQSRRRA